MKWKVVSYERNEKRREDIPKVDELLETLRYTEERQLDICSAARILFPRLGSPSSRTITTLEASELNSIFGNSELGVYAFAYHLYEHHKNRVYDAEVIDLFYLAKALLVSGKEPHEKLELTLTRECIRKIRNRPSTQSALEFLDRPSLSNAKKFCAVVSEDTTLDKKSFNPAKYRNSQQRKSVEVAKYSKSCDEIESEKKHRSSVEKIWKIRKSIQKDKKLPSFSQPIVIIQNPKTPLLSPENNSYITNEQESN
jgi:hypothetical protein